ncbi:MULTISPECIES: hypothetical protein [unclassified Mesorhizobium]|uniref:hypothetical protein n=1 Tax=unclassified Mesorhizobium TaxID=325217 RepID=UPI0024168182|nr:MULTISPECIES: hypothetical protein [unclassified Mesorhizobium]MDG4901400.1 hypothetical protein [Mesorhizobium sp. WSM4962]MDG4918888.1 hypothetical protein [Mesorhizobium sp. WSM4989]
MNEKDDADPSIADFMQMRAWKHALLTTYTLSLSYFESEILRSLLRGGCSDIWLIADAEGYRSSLLERRSMRVGQEYRLIPVALPDGVFHAKCIYLEGDEGDLLLVGSGNVTFGGHGKNSEVFEALSADSAASAFRDFADFLEAIGSRPDITIARSEWVDDFAVRARLAADRGADRDGVPPVRLVHPVDDPVIDQLPGLLAPHGACTEAVVMSPYHDRDGLALRKLMETLNIPGISVAVTKAGASPFPFKQTDAWPCPVSPVKPSRKDKRFVHAKWYEFQTDTSRLLLTGSINATRKALTTSDNVELGVLRCLPADSAPLSWEAVGRPAFEPQERMPSGLKENEIVYASFDRHDAALLAGRIISLQSTEGFWAGRLIQADGDATSFDVAVKADGSFAVRSSALEAFSEMPALQVVMTKGEREARGWVHNEMFLTLSGRRRLTAGSLSRLMRGNGTDDDIEALLDYLSVQAEQHLRLFDRPVQKNSEEGEGRDGAEKSITVDLADLAPGMEGSPGAASSPGGSSTPDQFDVAMTRLRRMLLGHGRAKTMASRHSGELVLAEEQDPEEGGSDGQTMESGARKLGLADFEREMARLIKDAADKPGLLRGLLAMELEVIMWMRIHRLGDLDGAHDFLHSWFHKACRLAKPEQGRLTSLQQHVVTAASILFRLAAGAGHLRQIAAELHDSLERYFNGAVDMDEALRSLIPDVNAGFAALLSGVADEASLSDSLLEILSQRTTRQQLADALALATKGEPVPAEWEVFGSPVGAELHKALSGPDWRKKVKAGRRDMTACAFDYYSLSKSDAAAYSRLRIARCIHCKRFTVNADP